MLPHVFSFIVAVFALAYMMLNMGKVISRQIPVTWNAWNVNKEQRIDISQREEEGRKACVYDLLDACQCSFRCCSVLHGNFLSIYHLFCSLSSLPSSLLLMLCQRRLFVWIPSQLNEFEFKTAERTGIKIVNAILLIRKLRTISSVKLMFTYGFKQVVFSSSECVNICRYRSICWFIRHRRIYLICGGCIKYGSLVTFRILKNEQKKQANGSVIHVERMVA